IRTCRVIDCAARFDLADARREKVLAWVLSCESPVGGFGPNRRPTVQHTAAVLRTLRRLEAQPSSGRNCHETWLRNRLAMCWRERHALAPSDWLEAVGLIVEGLEQIEGAWQKLSRLKHFGGVFVHEAGVIWRGSSQSTQDTKFWALILSVWKDSSLFLDAELKKAWLPSWEMQLASRHPETGLKELADSVILLSRLFPEDFRQRASL